MKFFIVVKVIKKLISFPSQIIFYLHTDVYLNEKRYLFFAFFLEKPVTGFSTVLNEKVFDNILLVDEIVNQNQG